VRGLGALALFTLLAVALTWPMSWSPGRAVSLRGDYFINLWNFWWMGTALDLGLSPFTTDFLHHPTGISLARHTLSPLNSLVGSWFASALGGHDAFKLLLVGHFALSGWTAWLLARRLTGCGGGALLAGVAWAFNPYHAYYMGQMNVSTLEFLPLAGFFMVGAWRSGRWTDIVGVGLTAGLIAATSSYYLVYAAFLGGLVLLGGRSLAPDVPWLTGARRLVLGGLVAGAAVLAVSWPLISALMEGGAGSGGEDGVAADVARQVKRSNDLLGFSWVGPPERLVVSWPTMLGYTSLGVLVAGAAALKQHVGWIVAAAVFFILGLGPVLQIGGADTGVGLPYAWLADLPVFSLLRKPDRFFVLFALFVGLLTASAWKHVEARLRSGGARLAARAVVVLALCAEFTLAPLPTHEIPVSEHFDEFAGLEGVRAVVDLPLFGGTPHDARTNHFQTLHGLRISSGYVTNLALTKEHRRSSADWQAADAALDKGDARAVVELARAQSVQLVLLHKTEPRPRAARLDEGALVWAPFVFVRAELVDIRQRGHLEPLPVRPKKFARRRAALAELLGEPLLEDELLSVFPVR